MISRKPLKILSIDGGGVRGSYSSLLIIERFMEKLQVKLGLPDVPRPCEHFDLIGGTGIGGIIAIMLGRLGMSIRDCIETYRKVIAEDAFKPSRRRLRNSSSDSYHGPAFSAECLENAMKSVIMRTCSNRRCRDRQDRGISCPHFDKRFRSKTCTKTAVLAITKDNVDAPPTLLRTYDSSAAFESCTIWKVARATSAAVGFFDSIRLGRDEIEFIDAAYGYNNPCEVLIQEAQKQFPDRGEMRALSVGSGLGDVITFEDTTESIMNALHCMATSSKRVERRMSAQFANTDQYFRFNVVHGCKGNMIADSERFSTVSAHTHNYLLDNEEVMERCVNSHCVDSGYSENEPRIEPAIYSGSYDHSAEDGTLSIGEPLSKRPRLEWLRYGDPEEMLAIGTPSPFYATLLTEFTYEPRRRSTVRESITSPTGTNLSMDGDYERVNAAMYTGASFSWLHSQPRCGHGYWRA